MAINDGGRNNETSNTNGKRNGYGNLREVENFTGDFSEGGDPCGSGDGYTVRKNKHNHTATNRKNRAEEWQQEASNTAQSYGELLTAQAYFSKMAKRYGLIKEFRENGII